MTWLWIAAAAWLVGSPVISLGIGRAVQLAETYRAH